MNKKQVFIIAEAGVNHNGSLDTAKKMVDVAVKAKADAIKFQTFTAEKVMSKFAPKADYQMQTTIAQESQLEMVKKLELGLDAHKILIEYCNKSGIQFLSTPFDLDSVTLLSDVLQVPIMKIPSGEITNGPLLLEVARKCKPIILSTGMSTLGDIETALGILAFGYLQIKDNPCMHLFQEAFSSIAGQELLKQNITLLHCTTEYPAPYDSVNLRAMQTLKTAFGLKVGLSDHTVGIHIPVAAVTLGATVIEKHFTLDRNMLGPDHKASVEPCELVDMVRNIREVELALGSDLKYPSNAEKKNMNIARKSLIANKKINKGDVFTRDNLTVKRPGNGISPLLFWDFIGKKAEKIYEEDDLI